MNYRLFFVGMLFLALLAGCGGGSGQPGLSQSLSGGGPGTTTWYADAVAGSDSNDCKSPQTSCKTMGRAMAMASGSDPTINVAAGTYAENPDIASNVSMTFIGAGAGLSIIDAGGIFAAVRIEANATVTVSGFTLQNGARGGVQNFGTLTINNSTITGNSAGPVGISGDAGGGIYNAGTLVLNNSAITGNVANGSRFVQGGGIYNTGSATINNTTLEGNSAISHSSAFPSAGGAVAGSGTISINNSTISGNSADSGGGISAMVTIQNSIVAGNTGGNCSSAATSSGYNLSDDGTCNFSGPGDQNNVNPLLGPLQNNGGPTPTMALPSGSPAIDAGNPSGCTDGQGHLLKTDQRGQPRSDAEDSAGCDIGAYERQRD